MRLVTSGKLKVPVRVNKDDQAIAAYYGDRSNPRPKDFEELSAPPSILDRFTSLRTEKQVLTFARRFGLMAARKSVVGEQATYDYSPDEKWWLEPIRDWLTVAARLRNTRKMIHRAKHEPMSARARRKLAGEIRFALQLDLLRVDLRPVLAFDDTRSTFVLQVASVTDVHGVPRFIGCLSAVIYHLVQEAQSPDAKTASCSICGTPYVPSRRPAASRANYCPTCRQKPATIREKWRRQKAAQRAKKGVE